MLNNVTVIATLAVKDMGKARKFYEENLGLKVVEDGEGMATYASGDGKLFVYESQTGGTGQATCATWVVDDIEATVQELKGKGVKFEHFDMPGAAMEGDVSVMGDEKAAWFKDPSGNTLAVVSSK